MLIEAAQWMTGHGLHYLPHGERGPELRSATQAHLAQSTVGGITVGSLPLPLHPLPGIPILPQKPPAPTPAARGVPNPGKGASDVAKGVKGVLVKTGQITPHKIRLPVPHQSKENSETEFRGVSISILISYCLTHISHQAFKSKSQTKNTTAKWQISLPGFRHGTAIYVPGLRTVHPWLWSLLSTKP